MADEQSEDADVALIQRALDGDPQALARLIERLRPVIQTRAACVLQVRARDSRRIRQELEDFVQEIFASILIHDWRALRAWDPRRKASLETFVGILATNCIHSILRSRKRNPWTESPSTADALDARRERRKDDPEHLFATRELLDRVLDGLEREVGKEGMTLFQTIVLGELPVEEVSAMTGMTKGAIYSWRSRVSKLAREIARRVTGGEGDRKKLA